MLKILIALFIILPASAFAQRDICDIIKIPNCPAVTRQIRRSSMQSLPSPSVAASLNPANTTFDRGLGLELIFQPGNTMAWGFSTGTGKIGGALISSSLENSFFGNRNVEVSDNFLERNKEQKQFEANKNTLALGGRVLGKRKYNLDLGIILKRHKEVRTINPGFGASAKLNFLTLGYAVYKDDFFLRRSDIKNESTAMGYETIMIFQNKDTYSEDFMVNTFSAGTRFRDLSIDVGWITSNYKYLDAQKTQLIALSYAYKKFLFNLAQRKDDSDLPKYKDGQLDFIEKHDTNYYGGVQYSVGKHLILGVAYNYFLLREVSLNTTFFL